MTELIADIGSNWHTLQDCMRGIRVANEMGAQVAKFQLYTFKDLYGFDGDRLPKELPREWIPALKAEADRVGIEFMCTPFSPDGVRFLDDFVDRWKIASSNACDYMLVEAVRKTKKPVIISVGAKYNHQVHDIVSPHPRWVNEKLTLLYCVADYLTAEKSIDLFHIDRLRAEFPTVVNVGFSDHSCNSYFALAAAYFHNASTIEVHLNPSPSSIQDTPDARHSLSPGQLFLLAERLKTPFPSPLEPTIGETDMEKMHNVRMVASRDIAQGEEMALSVNVAIARSRTPSFDQINPIRWPVTRMERANCDIKQGTAITDKMLVPRIGTKNAGNHSAQ